MSQRLTADDLPLYEVAVFADAQLPTELHCNIVRAFLYMGWLHQPNQHEPVPKRSGKSSRNYGEWPRHWRNSRGVQYYTYLYQISYKKSRTNVEQNDFIARDVFHFVK